MSRRPRVKSPRERVVERLVQADRARRDRQMRRRAGAPGEREEPHITCYGRGPARVPVPAVAQRWIASEARDQLRHYHRIMGEMDRLAPLREQWVAEFFARIQGPRGFSVHAGQRRTIAPGEIALRPKRAWRVVW